MRIDAPRLALLTSPPLLTVRELNGTQVDEAELEVKACAMGYGAVKYFDLKSHRRTDYKFR